MQVQVARSLVTVFLFSTLLGCGLFNRRQPPPPPPPPSVEASAPHVTHETQEAVAEAAPGALAEASGHVEAKAGPGAEQALSWLKNGNKRFVKSRWRKDGQNIKDVKRLVVGQHPHTIVLSCSDSRVPPEIVFDQKLGEIFVVRTAGQSLDHNVIGSIEYAVAHLHSKLILVMGHSSCGAVNAALKTISGGDAGSPSLNGLVADLHPRLKLVSSQGPPSANGAVESFANARGVAADLVARSTLLKGAVDRGELTIRSALYHLDSGVVEF